MNSVVLMGRLTKDPEIRGTETKVARYALAVDRRRKDETDFINIVAFGKAAEFAENYLHKGSKVCIAGRIQTGFYTDKDGKRVNTFDVVAESQEFADSKKQDSGFTPVPEQEELPFK